MFIQSDKAIKCLSFALTLYSKCYYTATVLRINVPRHCV